ncbi:MAG TPA: ABC transporter permease [Anaerolineales bacterium]|jgi:lipopolysaccharide transport system permease protein|nr:ABC transporter permease [Anaerolineales bacterium]
MTQATVSTRSSEEVIILRPSRGWGSLNLGDLWKYRELIYFLTWRDIKVRYKQTILGAAWAILQPFLSMVVFTIFFGGLLKVSSGNVPYPIFSYTALLPWGVFSKALTDAGRSLVINRNMITKVYFPRLVVPLASVLSGVVDFLIAFVVLLGMMVYFHVTPSSAVWALPFLLILALVTALGVGLWLSALNVIYRDVGYVLPFLTQFWFYITPVVYSSTEVPDKWRLIYALNPMTGVVEGFRWALLNTENAPGPMVAVSAAIAVIILVTGMFYFRRMERTFADMV